MQTSLAAEYLRLSTSMFPLQVVRAQFLVGELRSYMPCDTVKKKFSLKKKTKLKYFEICGPLLKEWLKKILQTNEKITSRKNNK